MGKLKKVEKVKLIIGIIAPEQGLGIADEKIKEILGEIDFESEILPFTHTDYYEEEFGGNLYRKFISLKDLILPEELPKCKIITNEIEETLSSNNKREINLDPGYLSLSKLVLASTKDYFHRIYIGQSIFAEVTLFYKDKTFQPTPWTYPDYKTKDYIDIFNHIREIYKKCLKY